MKKKAIFNYYFFFIIIIIIIILFIKFFFNFLNYSSSSEAFTMSNNSLLICIPFHYSDNRWQYLEQILHTFLNTYSINIHIIIDTNDKQTIELVNNNFKKEKDKIIEVIVHTHLDHPFDLTWKHRQHFLDNIDKYMYCMYVEDDMDIPFNNYKNYLNNFSILWPEYVPTFIRYEVQADGKYSSEHSNVTEISKDNIIVKGSKKFIELNVTYCACWIMPMNTLKNNIIKEYHIKQIPFDHGSYRETAASYTTWQLKKKGLVELNEDNTISDYVYIHHIPSNYSDNTQKYNRLLLKNLVRII